MTRGASLRRVTVIAWSNSTSAIDTLPLMGAAVAGSAAAATGRWPSAANMPEVGSSPTQPAPGRYVSTQACRSVKSRGGPAGPSRGFTSGTS